MWVCIIDDEAWGPFESDYRAMLTVNWWIRTNGSDPLNLASYNQALQDGQTIFDLPSGNKVKILQLTGG